jgi:hypothetical protein
VSKGVINDSEMEEDPRDGGAQRQAVRRPVYGSSSHRELLDDDEDENDR